MSTTFWDRLWRSAGIQFVVLFLIAYFIYGASPMLVRRPTRWSRFTTAIA